jgi:hypothetical protein
MGVGAQCDKRRSLLPGMDLDLGTSTLLGYSDKEADLALFVHHRRFEFPLQRVPGNFRDVPVV